MGKQPDDVKLMAIALLNYADDFGYFYAEANLVRAFARPFDDSSATSQRCLDELSRIGYIDVYEHPERGPIGLVVAFGDHQKVDKPKASRIKQFHSATNPRRIDDASALEGKGKEWKGWDVTPPSLSTDQGLDPVDVARAFLVEFNLTGKSFLDAAEQAIILRSSKRKITAEVAGTQIQEEYRTHLEAPGDPQFKKGACKWLGTCNVEEPASQPIKIVSGTMQQIQRIKELGGVLPEWAIREEAAALARQKGRTN